MDDGLANGQSRSWANRLRLAELTSGLGAVVLGTGLGALLASHLGSLGVPILLVGVLVHGWGMFDKHRLESRGDLHDVWWEKLLYWACWVLLIVTVILVVIRLT